MVNFPALSGRISWRLNRCGQMKDVLTAKHCRFKSDREGEAVDGVLVNFLEDRQFGRRGEPMSEPILLRVIAGDAPLREIIRRAQR